MRDELQKLIKELRNDAERIAADHTRTNVCDQLTGAICHWCATKRLLINTEARLQSILDADDAEPERIALYCPTCVAAIDRPAQAEQVGNRVTPADVNADCWPPAPPMHDYEESHDQPGYVCGIHNLFHVDGCPECEAGLPGKEDDNDPR